MIICGIDSSTQKTGMSKFDSASGKLLTYTLIDLHKMKEKDKRIDQMILNICVQLNLWKPDVIYIEDTWDRNNIETLKMLTYIVGAVRYWCIENNKDFNKFIPAQWRKLVGLQKNGIKRSDYKQISIDYVKKKYGIDVNDDEADSILIGEAGIVSQSMSDDGLFE